MTKRAPAPRSYPTVTVEQLRPEHLAPLQASADVSGLPQTVWAWEGGESQGRDTACLSMACPLPGQAPAGAVGAPLLTLLPAGYFR